MNFQYYLMIFKKEKTEEHFEDFKWKFSYIDEIHYKTWICITRKIPVHNDSLQLFPIDEFRGICFQIFKWDVELGRYYSPKSFKHTTYFKASFIEEVQMVLLVLLSAWCKSTLQLTFLYAKSTMM